MCIVQIRNCANNSLSFLLIETAYKMTIIIFKLFVVSIKENTLLSLHIICLNHLTESISRLMYDDYDQQFYTYCSEYLGMRRLYFFIFVLVASFDTSLQEKIKSRYVLSRQKRFSSTIRRLGRVLGSVLD